MITYLPEIYPDELVYSWFCRYYVYSGCFSHKMALLELLYKRCNNPSKEFIGHLNPDAEAKIKEMYDMDYLILKHTMFPQYARFLPSSDKKNALYHLGYDFCDAHFLFSILPRNEGERNLKYCPMCAAEDRVEYGETYWHRKHQIRNMSICTKHRCKLIESKVTAKSNQTFTLCPAEDFTNDKSVQIEENPTLIQFAEYMESIFDAPMNFEDEIPLSAILYYGMKNTKYLKQSGRSRYTQMFSNDMKDFYEKLNLYSIASLSQIQRALLGMRYDFTVVNQIAFFLGMSISELINPSLTKEQIEHEQNTHYARDFEPVNWKEFDEELAPLFEQIAKSIFDGSASEIGRPERVSEKMMYKEMELPSQRLLNMPKCKAIFERYTESYPESWARKVIWAYHKMKDERGDIPFYWSDVRLLAGVKKANMPKVIPFIPEYADKATTDAIIVLVGME